MQLAITKYISIKTILPLVLNPKHIKVCFHFLNFPLIKFHLRGFHLLQNIFSGPSFTNAYSSYNSYNDGDKKVCQVKQVFMGMHEYKFFCTFSCNAVWKIASSNEILNKLYFLFAKEKSANLVKKIIISECKQNISTSKLPPPCSFKRVHICVRDQFYFICNLLIIQLAKEYFQFLLFDIFLNVLYKVK